MSCTITKGMGRACKSRIGGLKRVYIFPYVKKSKKDIITDGLKVVSYPETQIFRFELSGNYGFNQTPTRNEEGLSYRQSLALDFQKIHADTELQILLKKDYQTIVETNDGKYMILGLYNGGIFNNLSQVTGSNKNSFNGYKINFEATEGNQAYFIDDLTDAGFVEEFVQDFLLLENSTELIPSFLLQEAGTDNRIILEP